MTLPRLQISLILSYVISTHFFHSFQSSVHYSSCQLHLCVHNTCSAQCGLASYANLICKLRPSGNSLLGSGLSAFLSLQTLFLLRPPSCKSVGMVIFKFHKLLLNCDKSEMHFNIAFVNSYVIRNQIFSPQRSFEFENYFYNRQFVFFFTRRTIFNFAYSLDIVINQFDIVFLENRFIEELITLNYECRKV